MIHVTSRVTSLPLRPPPPPEKRQGFNTIYNNHILQPNFELLLLLSHMPGCTNPGSLVTGRVILYRGTQYFQHNYCSFFLMYKNVGGQGDLSRYSDALGMDGPGIDSRWGASFSVPVQTSPGAHPSSYTTGIGCLSRG
jgi:hypothetical protein